METVIDFFKENNWSYLRKDEKPFLENTFRGNNGEWPCQVFANEEQQRMVFYSVCPFYVAEDRRIAMSEFITRLNYGLGIGNFELDFEDGEIRFKTSIDVKGDRLNIALVEQVIMINLAIMDDCLPGLMKVIYGDTSPTQTLAEMKKTVK
jgi:hypothetical protein